MSRATSRAPSSRSPTPRSTASTSATILSDHPIAARWREVRGEGRAALIPYLTAGFPTPGASLDALRLAEAAGADVVEVGVPFSDPLADGPTTTDERLAGAVRGASGFIYLISRLGVTGARDRIPPDLAEQVARVRAVTSLPIAAGFGISTAAQVRAAARAADGVVVGSALVDVLATAGLAAGERLLREFARAVRERD